MSCEYTPRLPGGVPVTILAFHIARRIQPCAVSLGTLMLITSLVLVGCDTDKKYEESFKLLDEGRWSLRAPEDKNRAERFFLKALEVNPTFTQARAELIRLNFSTNSLEKVKHHALEWIKVNPNSIFAHYYLGVVAFEEGDFQYALREFETTHHLLDGPFGLKAGRHWFSLLVHEGALLYDQGDFHRSETILKQAQSYGPDPYLEATSGVFGKMAHMYIREGQYAKAKPLIKQSLLIMEQGLGTDHPKAGEALVRFAEAYREKGQFSMAGLLYRQSLGVAERAMPNSPTLVKRLGVVAHFYLEIGRDEEAKRLFDQAKRIEKNK